MYEKKNSQPSIFDSAPYGPENTVTSQTSFIRTTLFRVIMSV